MKRVGDILASKGHEIWAVAPGTSVFDALQLMADKRIGAVLVVEGRELVGVFSERDYARKIILLGKSSRQTPVDDIMSRELVCVDPDQLTADCMRLMTENRVRHLPVMSGRELQGIITIGDVVKAIIAEKEEEIEQLQHYITGTV
jgi:CBS domain-containing protein